MTAACLARNCRARARRAEGIRNESGGRTVSDEKEFPNVVIIPYENRYVDPVIHAKLIDIAFEGVELKPDHKKFLEKRVAPFLRANDTPDTRLIVIGEASRK